MIDTTIYRKATTADISDRNRKIRISRTIFRLTLSGKLTDHKLEEYHSVSDWQSYIDAGRLYVKRLWKKTEALTYECLHADFKKEGFNSSQHWIDYQGNAINLKVYPCTYLKNGWSIQTTYQEYILLKEKEAEQTDKQLTITSQNK